jgi:hypothetical protein
MPGWFFALIGAALFAGGYLLAGSLLRRRGHVQARHKGLLVAMVAGASIVILQIGLRQAGIDLFRGVSRQIFQIALLIAFLGLSMSILVARRRAGAALADLGPSPLRWIFLACGCSLIVVTAAGVVDRSFSTAQSAMHLAQSAFFLLFGLSRFQIRSHGVLYGGSLLRWSRIDGYQWRQPATLTLQLRRRRWGQDRVWLPVPPVLVPQVDHLMEQHVPTHV